MTVADLTERITIKEKVKSTAPNGEIIYTWQDIATVWANVNPISGSENYNADGVLIRKKYAFKMRYREDFTEEAVIEYNGKDYDIAVIDPMFSEMRKRFIYVEANYHK